MPPAGQFAETNVTCPEDCASNGCGDGVCSANETAASCYEDCHCG